MRGSRLDPGQPKRGRVGEDEFAWLDEGEGRPGDSPLVLIHGFTGHRDDFFNVVPELAKKRRVLALDLRGHGDSAASVGTYGWTFEQLLRDLRAWLDELEIDRCHLFGHSMGGMLTLRFALAHPERIESLIFMCTAPALPAGLSRTAFETGTQIAAVRGMEGLQTLMEKAGRQDCSETIARWGDRYWPHHRRRLCAMTPESFAGIGTAFFDSESLVDRLPELRAPTQIIVGEFDGDFLPGADLFEKHLPNAKRTTLANAEHHPHQENREDFLAAVEAHLDAVSQARSEFANLASEGETI